MTTLAPLPVAGPLLVAGLLLVPGKAPDILAVLTARAADGPLVCWFGGFATMIGALFVATLVFAWGHFDEVHAHFHVLMLVFMAGMTGFCLTRDVFNMFAWFEVMSVAAFALTGYELKANPLKAR